MDLRDQMSVYLRLWDKIHFFWHWYVGSLVLLVGWSMSHNETPGVERKIIFSLLFLALVGMNISGLLRSYMLASAARKDLKKCLTEYADESHLGAALSSLEFSYPLLALIYVAGMVVGLLAIWNIG